MDEVRGLIAKRHPDMVGDGPVGLMVRQQTGLEIIGKGGRREVDIIINTDDIDLDGEVVVPAGIDFDYWEKSGKRTYADHSYNIEDIAGHTRWITPMGNAKSPSGWVARAVLNTSPIGEAIKQLIEDDGTIGASVGFIPKDRSRPTADETRVYAKAGTSPMSVVRDSMLLEWSYTGMPCNGSAIGGWADDGGKAYNKIDRLLTKSKITVDAAKMLGFPVEIKRIPAPTVIQLKRPTVIQLKRV